MLISYCNHQLFTSDLRRTDDSIHKIEKLRISHMIDDALHSL